MAPRRGIDRLVAALAEAKSARTIVLALAVAAMVAVAGCGGGDDDSSPSSTQETTTTAEAGKEGNEGKDGKGEEGQGKGKQGAEGDGEGKQGEGNAGPALPEGERAPKITPEQREKATVANITLESPDFESGDNLAAKYTCDGKDTWPSLKWNGSPSEAEELVLLVLSVRPVVNKLWFNWAVAGLDPSLKEIEEGKLPKGAIVGENSFGNRAYSLCPDKGQKEPFIFMLFAIPDPLDPAPGFDARELREEVLAQSGNVGLLNAVYTRK